MSSHSLTPAQPRSRDHPADPFLVVQSKKPRNSAANGNSWSVWYKFAGVAAAANRPDDALQYLQEAVHRGYKNADALMADDDLKKLHRNPKFQQLVAELQHPPDKHARTQ